LGRWESNHIVEKGRAAWSQQGQMFGIEASLGNEERKEGTPVIGVGSWEGKRVTSRKRNYPLTRIKNTRQGTHKLAPYLWWGKMQLLPTGFIAFAEGVGG